MTYFVTTLTAGVLILLIWYFCALDRGHFSCPIVLGGTRVFGQIHWIQRWWAGIVFFPVTNRKPLVMGWSAQGVCGEQVQDLMGRWSRARTVLLSLSLSAKQPSAHQPDWLTSCAKLFMGTETHIQTHIQVQNHLRFEENRTAWETINRYCFLMTNHFAVFLALYKSVC